MAHDARYHDRRADFWRRHFDRALPYQDYLAQSKPDQAEKWRRMESQMPPLTPEQSRRIQAIRRAVNVLAYSGAWCGDCVRQGPMIERIAAAAGNGARVRWIDRDASVDLQEELRVVGALRVPMFVFLTEDFWEIGRFGDRSLTAYRAKAERELGAACSTGLVAPPPEQLGAEQTEWVDIFERVLLMARLAPPLRARHGD